MHCARRTGDYTFFKTLQAHTLINGLDHVAILHTILGDQADSILSTLDNLNAGIAYVHQDAFKAVYDSAKSTMYKVENTPSNRRSLLRVDICQQRDMADLAIDKTTNSAINLIEGQPVECQEAIANAWITGATIVADAVCTCLKQMDDVEEYMDDFIRLEYSWSCIQNSVDAAISALRGIFNLMATTMPPGLPRNLSTSSASSTAGSEAPTYRGRQSSIASGLGLIKRALSHTTMSSLPSAKTSRTGSLPTPDTNSRGLRMSISAACPTRMPAGCTMLTTIPCTPADPMHNTISPFKEKDDYFAFDMDPKSDNGSKDATALDDLMQL